MKNGLLSGIAILFFAVIFVFTMSTMSATNSRDTVLITDRNEGVVSRVAAWYTGHLNYGTIVLLMTVESSFVPFPSEVVVPPAAYAACNNEHPNLYVTPNKYLNLFFVVLFATLGAMLGSLINYFLALWLGRPLVYWFADSKIGHLLLLNGEKIKKSEDYFVSHGNISTFIGRLVPGIRQLISIPAGVSKMPMRPFLFFTFLGALIWNTILAILGYVAHGQKAFIDKYSHILSWVLIGLGVIFVLYLVRQSFVKSRKS
ncbi:MAG: DedA family protein [Bacteroidales bacterium]|jgi:membrane protein DedA with SNARE-associated domain|nr:DedA family protein [Bacteroidales bacterium]